MAFWIISKNNNFLRNLKRFSKLFIGISWDFKRFQGFVKALGYFKRFQSFIRVFTDCKWFSMISINWRTYPAQFMKEILFFQGILQDSTGFHEILSRILKDVRWFQLDFENIKEFHKVSKDFKGFNGILKSF